MANVSCTCTATDAPCPACQPYGATQRPTAHRQGAPGTAGVRTREDTLADALREEARQMRTAMQFARRHRITGDAAQRFFARARASLRRQRQAVASAEVAEDPQLSLLTHVRLQTAAQILCPRCRQWWRITSIPFRTPCCAAVLLVEDEQ